MGPTRFGAFIRALTQRTPEIPSRRMVLHALGGLFAAGALTASESDAKRKKKPKKCKGGKKKCGKRCVDLQTDGGNCGSCGTVCGNDERCQGGACLNNGPCPVNQIRCEGQCVDIYTEPANCGGCGNACAANETCLLGDCCLPHGQICGSHGQCCSEVCSAVEEVKPGGQVCHMPGVAGRCCVAKGYVCSDACDCCGSTICVDQRCCLGGGQTCEFNGQCCDRRCGSDGLGPTCL